MANVREIPVTEDYIPTWGIIEALRELIANGIDEQNENSNTFTWRWSRGTVELVNVGADMTYHALLYGYTSKRGKPGLIGRHGEGFVNSLLALTRGGYTLDITTKEERWVPEWKVSKQYPGVKTLHVNYRKLPKGGSGVGIRVYGVAEQDFLAAERLFLKFHPSKEVIHIPSVGEFLLDEAFKGTTYAHGVRTKGLDTSGLPFGVNLTKDDLEINRDREFADPWSANYALSKMVVQALQSSPEQSSKLMYRLLEEGSTTLASQVYDRLRYLSESEVTKTIDALRAEFERLHGTGAVPVLDLAQQRDVEHLGRRAAYVGKSLYQVLALRLPTVEKLKKEKDEIETRVLGWSELTEIEQTNLLWACEILRDVSLRFSGMKQISVVSFPEGIENLADVNMSSGAIRMDRRLLDKPLATLDTIIHEIAHLAASAEDNDSKHTSQVSLLWATVFDRMTRDTFLRDRYIEAHQKSMR